MVRGEEAWAVEDAEMMETIYSPSNIELLLWCHTMGAPHPRLTAPAVWECFGEFLEMGAIEADPESEGVYRTTEMGQAWVKALCRTPPPRQVYVDEMGRVL